VDPVPDPLLLRKSGSAGDRTRDLCICSQKLWPLDHRGGRIVVHTFQYWRHNQLGVRLSVWVPVIPTVWNPYEVSGWQAICNRRRCEASCYLPATDTWHGLLSLEASLVATLGQTLKCQRWIRGGLMCIIGYPCALRLSKSEPTSRLQGVCWLIFKT